VETVVAFRPEIVDGYPSAVHIFAEHVLRTGDERLRPRAAMLTAETVLSRQRETIEKAFACKVYNQYSSQEGAPYISECRDGSLHVHPDSGICEILDERGAPAPPGEAGNLVVTSFMTSVTPLLRFSTEDVAVPAAPGTRCPCGSSFPVVEAVVGRVDDILHTPDRGFVGRLDPVFKKLPNSVVEAQIVQTAPDRIVARLVPDRSRYVRHHADLLLEEMRKRLGRVVQIEVEEVDHLPRGARGKLRPVVNLCADRLPQSLRYRVPLA
jgi:phenylacetate-CoA ligase